MKRAVVDQPGLKMIFVGLMTAIFFGLSIRSQITSHKINSHLKNLVQNFQEKHKDQNLMIDFSDARLRLSDWGMPFPHLEINNIKVSSLNVECADNQLFIDHLDIPFSWSNLFSSKVNFKNFVDTIRISQAELRLNNIDQCIAPKPKESTSSVNLKADRQTASDIMSTKQDDHELNVLFEKIKIIDKHNYNLPIMLQALTARLTLVEGDLRRAQARSQMFLFKDVERSLYQVRTDLILNYSQDSKKEIAADLTLRGKLIDKTFDLKLNYDNPNNKILISHTMVDLSLKALIKLFNQNDLGQSLQKQADGITGLAFSNQGHGEYNLKNPRSSFYKVTDLSISSGESTVTSENIVITSFKPFIFSPFKISLNDFNLEKIKTIAALSTVQKSINNFGKVSGVIHVNTNGSVTSEGVISDLEFIFSNRGRRANQKISEIKYAAGESKVVLSGLVLEDQKVTGEIDIDLATRTNGRRVAVKLSDIKLNDAVYEIFSFNQDKKTLISLNADLENNLLKARLRFDQLVSTYFEVKQAEANYTASIDPVTERVKDPVLDLQIRNLRINKVDTSEDSFYSVLDQLEPDSTIVRDFYFDAVKAKYIRKDANLFDVHIAANYFSKVKSEKVLVSINSQYIDPSSAIFNLNTQRGDKHQSIQIQSDLNRFIFEPKK